MEARLVMSKLAVAVAFALTAGCATTNTQTTETESVAVTDNSSSMSADLDSRSAALDSREAELRKLEANLAASSANSASDSAMMGDLLPPDAKSGECYARVWVPEEYRTVSEQLLASEESETISVIPATYEWTTEEVEVSAASSKTMTTDAVYGTESEQVLVRDASTYWKRTFSNKTTIASDGLVAFAKEHGADLDSATVGMCYHEHTIPATYTTREEEVLASEASEVVSAIPATYEMVEKTIVVSEASTRIVQVPATYRTVSEEIMVKPAHTIWKKGSGPVQRIDQSTGEIMCLVEVPAQYKTVTKRVVDTVATTETVIIPEVTKTVMVRQEATSAGEERTAIPATYKTISITEKASDADVTWHEIHNHDHPTSTRTGQKICLAEEKAIYKTVTKRVVTTPASSYTVDIPAQSKMMKVQKLVTEASEERTVIPATYKEVETQELVSDGYMQWRSILCDTNTTPHRITQIQQALVTKGYNPGPIDGVIGWQTMQAINEFQAQEGLPVDKYLNVETIRALGVSVK